MRAYYHPHSGCRPLSWGHAFIISRWYDCGVKGKWTDHKQYVQRPKYWPQVHSQANLTHSALRYLWVFLWQATKASFTTTAHWSVVVKLTMWTLANWIEKITCDQTRDGVIPRHRSTLPSRSPTGHWPREANPMSARPRTNRDTRLQSYNTYTYVRFELIQ